MFCRQYSKFSWSSHVGRVSSDVVGLLCSRLKMPPHIFVVHCDYGSGFNQKDEMLYAARLCILYRHIISGLSRNPKLGGGFNWFLNSTPIIERKISYLTHIFSDGKLVQPPTRKFGSLSPRKPWLRKQRAKQNKETRMKKREEQQMRLLSLEWVWWKCP